MYGVLQQNTTVILLLSDIIDLGLQLDALHAR